MQKLFKTLMLTLMTVACASLSAAPVGYSVNSDSGSADHDGLYQIDLATGKEIQRIGTVQTTALVTIEDVEGLAFAADGTLYGIDDEQVKLFPIDINDFALVDPSKSFIVTGLAPGLNDFGMAFACDQNLYVTSVGKEDTPTRQSLYQVSLTGTSTLIGSPGSLGANISALAAYGNPVRLFGLGNGTAGEGAAASADLYEIDITTGVATKIGPLGPAVGPYTEAGLAFDESGQLWAITDRRILNLPSQVMRINTSTGTASDVRETTEQGFESLAIAPPSGCSPQGGGENAFFVVQKRFEDSNDITPVQLNISCNTGLPLEQSLTVLPNEGPFGHFEVTFIVESFTDGDLNCEVWEDTPAGYSPDYDCQSPASCSTGAGGGPCSFDGISSGQESLCLIQNYVDPVALTVTKEWLYNREELVVDDSANVQLYCENAFGGDGSDTTGGLMYWSWIFDGNPASNTATIYPDFTGTTKCWTEEQQASSAVEAESTCSNGILVALGADPLSCTVTNTVFFEGIPSLNRYGLLLITALMLLTGLIAVRRIG